MIDIEHIKRSNNIVDVIGKYIDLKKHGKNHFGCCPFHSEKTASFSVNEDKGFYHCFGCGAHGDVISFVQDYERIEFIDAVKKLGGEIEVNAFNKPIQNHQIRLPLDKKAYPMEDINNFLSTRCEQVNNNYFYSKAHVFMMTDIYKNIVSFGLDYGCQDNVKFYREFLHGSCVVFGNIEECSTVMLCHDYHKSKKIFNKVGSAVICYFICTNLRFIANQLKKYRELLVITTDEESANDADDLNLQFMDYKKTGVFV